MPKKLDAEHVGRLQSVAVSLLSPSASVLDDAIRLAEDLVAGGVGGFATLDVAALSIGAPSRDAEPAVRAMLAEFDLEPPAEDDVGRYQVLLWLFGHAELPLQTFEQDFYSRLESTDEQTELDRVLMGLSHELDQLYRPADRRRVENEMRGAVRAAVPRKGT